MNDPIQLEIFKHGFASVADEMGVVLQRTAYSPNIKERRDFSCALFDAHGRLIAQAEHIPVHLGAMPLSVEACLHAQTFAPGDVVLLNDPYHGGTHLPDLTMVAPLFTGSGGALLGFVANRAHHADIGGMSPGSMPLSQDLFQEGLVIPPIKLVREGRLMRDLWNLLLANVRTPGEREGDLRAQLGANRTGIARMEHLIQRYGPDGIRDAMEGLLVYSERMTRRLIADLPDGTFRFEDALDDDGLDLEPASIVVSLIIDGDQATVDFSGTCPQRRGNINAVYAITVSAVAYVFRCVLGLDIPANGGCMAPIHVLAPPGSLVNARSPGAVAAGNVETSQRIVDVILGALAQVRPDLVPAASQGTMNNVTIGGWDPKHHRPYAYYETLGGGMGARPGKPGASAIHSHMTNTQNTPIEALEYAYPLRVRRYGVREGSGGAGRYRGGDGLCREIEMLAPARVTLLSDRRTFPPYGLAGGEPGQLGRNRLRRGSRTIALPGKTSVDLRAGDILVIETPGGGGYGPPPGQVSESAPGGESTS